MNFSKLLTIVLALIMWNIFSGLKMHFPLINSFGGGGAAFAAEDDPFAYNEIKALLTSKKDLVGSNRINGMLTELLREQKKLFTAKKGTGKNETALKIENLMNEASLTASKSDYHKTFKILDDAHETLMESIRQLLGKGSGSR